MVRATIGDSQLVKKSLAGHTVRPCISCNSCVMAKVEVGTIRCAVNASAGDEYLHQDDRQAPSASPRRIVIANRTLAKAAALGARHATLAAANEVELRALPLAEVAGSFDVVLNATATSLAGAGVPVPGSVLKPGALACDLMYGPAAAPFLQWAQEHGAVGRDGLGMLVEQAAEAFLLWRGVRPATARRRARPRRRPWAAPRPA